MVSVFFLVLSSIDTLSAQDTSSKVHDLYFESIAYPENFDDSFALLEASGDRRIQSCLVALRDTSFQLARAAIDQCRRAHGGNPQREWKCLKSDPNASMYFWAKGLVQLISGEITSWRNTFTGGNMLTAKTLAEQMQQGSWVQMIQMGMPMIRRTISCP